MLKGLTSRYDLQRKPRSWLLILMIVLPLAVLASHAESFGASATFAHFANAISVPLVLGVFGIYLCHELRRPQYVQPVAMLTAVGIVSSLGYAFIQYQAYLGFKAYIFG